MKKIFIMYCNPKGEDSLSFAIAEKYLLSALKANNEVKMVNIYDYEVDYLNFNKDISYQIEMQKKCKENNLTPELRQAQENLVWADQLVFIYPVWWGGIPAKLKSFVETVFQAGVAVDISPDSKAPVPKFCNKTAVVVQTYFMPVFYMKTVAGDISFKSFNKGILQTCGIKTEKRFDFGLAVQKPDSVEKFLKKIEKFALSIK